MKHFVEQYAILWCLLFWLQKDISVVGVALTGKVEKNHLSSIQYQLPTSSSRTDDEKDFHGRRTLNSRKAPFFNQGLRNNGEDYNFKIPNSRKSLQQQQSPVYPIEKIAEKNHFLVSNSRSVHPEHKAKSAYERQRGNFRENRRFKLTKSRNTFSNFTTTKNVSLFWRRICLRSENPGLKSGILKRQKRRSRPFRAPRCDVNSCENRCSGRRDFGGANDEKRCACDNYCSFFKDCCYDYVKKCHGGNSTIAVQNARIPNEQWSCRHGTWMITSCPDSWTRQSTIQRCGQNTTMTHENYVNLLPVTTPDKNTFANQFCARCHGYTNQQMSSYQLQFECHLTPSPQATLEEKLKFLFQVCKVSVNPKSGKPRRHCYQSVETCHKGSNASIVDKCEQGHYGLVYFVRNAVNYKNVYCAQCNNIKGVMCGPGETGATIKAPIAGLAKPFSVIMRIYDKDIEPTITCPDKMVYDAQSEVCRKKAVFTPIPVISESAVRKDRVVMWVKSTTKLSPKSTPFKKNTFISYLSNALMINSSAITSLKFSYLDHFLLMAEFNLDLSYLNDSKQSVISKKIVNFPYLPASNINIGSFNGTVVKVTVKPLTCVAADIYSSLQYQLIPGTSSVVINSTGEVLDKSDYFSNNTIMVQGRPHPVGNIVVCRQLLSGNCSGTYIFLDRHEYVMFPNRSLLYNAANRLYEYEEYTVMNGSIVICTKLTQTYIKQPKKENPVDETALIVLTYVGFFISIVSLVFVLVTYSLFSKLRTIPGINVMNLSCGLLVAHVVWLTGSGLTTNETVCTIIAVTLQYSFLASFMWMSIIAFDTWRAFSSRTYWPKTKDKKHKHNAIRLIIGWIPLVLFVSGCVALDQSDVVTIGYGNDDSCWITNSRANLCVFAVPIAISLVWNAVFFIQVIFEYVKIRKKSKLLVSQHQARRDTAIFARIAALMGFTWVFGFIAPLTTPYLMYPFVILNTLQGLYIAVAFGFTRRVKLMYKKRLCKNVVCIM